MKENWEQEHRKIRKAEVRKIQRSFASGVNDRVSNTTEAEA